MLYLKGSIIFLNNLDYPGYKYTPGRDCSKNDIQNRNIFTKVYLADCAQECNSHAECTGFSFYKGVHSSDCKLHSIKCEMEEKQGCDMFDKETRKRFNFWG